jgi:hypothetical protein
MPSLERVGVLALGLFVSYLLALGLEHSKPNLRVVITVIGVALTGAPVAFLAQAMSKWAYPLGLLSGIAAYRVVTLLGGLANLNEGPRPSRSPAQKRRILRELWLVGLLGAGVAAVAMVLPVRATATERGKIELRSMQGPQNVRYAHPFVNMPHLVFRPVGFVEYRIDNERLDGFTFFPTGYSSDSFVQWEATGEPAP